MFRVTVTKSFSAAHALKIGGKCEDLHGHNFKVDVTVEGRELSPEGLLIDFRDLKKWTVEVLDELDHKYLNELAPFSGDCATSERVARFIFEKPRRPDEGTRRPHRRGDGLGVRQCPRELHGRGPMIDVQSRRDSRKINIKKVGVKGIQYPIIVQDRANGVQHVNAAINMYVNLPHQFKGTHMSRFIEILNEYRGQINIRSFEKILLKMREKLNAKSAHMEIEFPYFIEKRAPVSGAKSLMDYRCWFTGENDGEKTDFLVGVSVPVTTVCPCSKEMSCIGAHNQRSIVRVQVRFRKFFWIEDVISLVESSASGEVYSLLKRVDEKHVTETAHANPMFVEDVVRSVAVKLNRDGNFTWYSVEAENIESIHNHSAYAYVEKE